MAFNSTARARVAVVGQPPDNYSRDWMRQFVDRLAAMMGTTVRTTEAAPYVLLRSPVGKVFQVTVSDTGVITAVEMAQGMGSGGSYLAASA
jgi:hypothetical protein